MYQGDGNTLIHTDTHRYTHNTAGLAGGKPSAGGGWHGGPARLGAARAHREAARGAANVLLGSFSTFTSEPLQNEPAVSDQSRTPPGLGALDPPLFQFSQIKLFLLHLLGARLRAASSARGVPSGPGPESAGKKCTSDRVRA